MKVKDRVQNSLLLLMLMVVFLTSFIALPGISGDEPMKGAKSAEQLSDVLYQAIKRNQFDELKNFIPGEEEIKYLKETSTQRNKLFFENLDAEKIESRVLTGFENITRRGIEQNINWSSAELVDYETRSCSIELIGCNVTYTILDQNGNRLVVTYDAIKAKDRWFVFQNLGLVKE